jgi:hypothetical protein
VVARACAGEGSRSSAGAARRDGSSEATGGGGEAWRALAARLRAQFAM